MHDPQNISHIPHRVDLAYEQAHPLSGEQIMERARREEQEDRDALRDVSRQKD